MTSSGFKGIALGKPRGITLLVEVEGMCGKECGSVYLWDVGVYNPESYQYEHVELTPAQVKKQSIVKGMGF
jgi:hypothetical protein